MELLDDGLRFQQLVTGEGLAPQFRCDFVKNRPLALSGCPVDRELFGFKAPPDLFAVNGAADREGAPVCAVDAANGEAGEVSASFAARFLLKFSKKFRRNERHFG